MTCLFGIVIFATYEADLTTRMTVKTGKGSLRSFLDIASSDYEVIVAEGSSQLEMLQNSRPGHSIHEIYQRLKPGQILDITCNHHCKEEMLKVYTGVYSNDLLKNNTHV